MKNDKRQYAWQDVEHVCHDNALSSSIQKHILHILESIATLFMT